METRVSNNDNEFGDAALVLLGHGSTVNADSSAPVYQHAAALRGRKLFASVREGFWKQEPRLIPLLESLVEPRVFIVPVFISEGYFTEQVIPRALGLRTPGQPAYTRVRRQGEKTLCYCAPVGAHPRLAEALVARAQTVVAEHPFPRAPKPAETALFLAGHGTPKNENSRQAIEQHAAAIRARRLYAEVHAVFLEEEPRIADFHRLTACQEVVMVPCFISDGMHAYEDIPVLLGEPERVVRERLQRGQWPWRNPTEKSGKRVWLSGSVGTDPIIAEVILERVRDCFRDVPAI